VGCGGGGSEKPASELLSTMVGRLMMSPFTSQKLTGVFAKVSAADLNILGDLLQSGKIEPALDRKYPLSGVAEALRYVESSTREARSQSRSRRVTSFYLSARWPPTVASMRALACSRPLRAEEARSSVNRSRTQQATTNY
jgi:hypothetical protein